MHPPRVDVPSLVMVVVFTVNIAVAYYDPYRFPVPREVGGVVFVAGLLLSVYVIAYLRKGFLGDTEPILDNLVTDGPYRFCRHPLYLSFFVLLFGIDLMFGSPVGAAFTVILSVPSAVYRARAEDDLLRKRFGREWEEYADRVGFMIPRF